MDGWMDGWIMMSSSRLMAVDDKADVTFTLKVILEQRKKGSKFGKPDHYSIEGWIMRVVNV
jgi:hypothetical protein